MAAEATGRLAALVELDPSYCDVIVRRWQEVTRQAAFREDGVSFHELAAMQTRAGEAA
jgi:DNA modification methylase